MSGVDNRVVKMTFDNAAFEKNIETTMTSLDKLKQSLKFEGAKNGISEISGAMGKVDTNTISQGIEGVSKKFMAMSAVAISALVSIASKAVDTGIALAKHLSLDNIIAGYQEYETNLGSIQTILANTAAKGGNLQSVNAALDQLNTYSDQTIYNFGQMAKNIGTFTAAGVDLDRSVASIKGIANVAALSGSTSEQASTAMYQLSQAIAAGSVKLMDWNSVVNAGMGGEVFQKALFNTGVQMGKIKDIPMGTTFEQWTKAGNTFRGSLETGWLTADVLTSTLSQFTGDMTDAQLASQGYTKEQIASIQQMAQVAKNAATEIKTFSQLTGTIKEAIGSGWSQSFRLIIGDFEQAKSLFTAIGQVVGNIVSKSADARNKVLQGWQDLGGRDVLLKGIAQAINGLWSILKPVKDAFREIFPPATAQTLLSLTKAFQEFAEKIKIGGETADHIKSIFKGFFSVIALGIDIVKGFVGMIFNLIGAVGGAAGGGFLEWAASIGDFLTATREMLTKGGAITDFFDKMGSVIARAIDWIKDLVKWIANLFSPAVANVSSGTSAAVDGLSNRLEHLSTVGEKLGAFWNWLVDKMQVAARGIAKAAEVISGVFKELMKKISDIMSPGDFSNILDGLEVGLLGGIVVILRKFLKNGFSIDFTGGMFDSLKQAFEQLTGTLKAMQTKLKAEALMRIAQAIAVLTASLVVLSMIDSVALTRALSAMAVGFAELVGSLALLDKMASSASAPKLFLLSLALIGMAAAMAVLSLAVKAMASLSWEELAKGLLGTTSLLLALAGVAQLISGSTVDMLKAGIGMVGISVGVWALAHAVSAFSGMSWADLAKGFLSVAVGMALMGATINLMPKDIASKGIAMLVLAVSMRVLANAVEAFSGMSWGSLVKGFAGVAAGLLIMGVAMNLMPKDMILTAVGLIGVGVALNIMAKAVERFGGMSMGDLAKGIGGIAAMLLILSVGMYAMTGTIAGAVALGVVTLALMGLVKVLENMSKIGLKNILLGLAELAISIAALAALSFIISPLVPALLALGAALLVAGAAMLLFGAGVALLGIGLASLATVGNVGIKQFTKLLESLVLMIPKIVSALVVGLIQGFQEIVDQAPKLIKGVEKILTMLLDAIIRLAPKIADALVTIISEAIDAVEKIIPKIVQLGVKIILAILQGIRDNIYNIVTLGLEILQQLVKGLADNIDILVTAAAQLLIAFVTAIANNIQMIIDAGVNILVNFLLGITRDVVKIVQAVTILITTFITAIANMYTQIAQAGTDALVHFLGGITSDIQKIVDAVGTLIITFITEIGKKATDIAKAGTDALVSFLNGLADDTAKITAAVGRLIMRFFKALGDMATDIADAGTQVAIKFLSGLEKNIGAITMAAVHFVLTLMNEMGKSTVAFADGAFKVVTGFLNAMADVIERRSGELRSAGERLIFAIIDGITGGLASKVKEATDKVVGFATGLFKAGMKAIGAASPSKLFMIMGRSMAEGVGVGVDKDTTAVNAVADLAKRTTEAFNAALSTIPLNFSDIDAFQPVITPVLDLSVVKRDAEALNTMLTTAPITAQLSTDQANLLSHTTDPKPNEPVTPPPPQPQEITFEQNIYSPTALSTNDIYRATRSQIALAKEELSIP